MAKHFLSSIIYSTHNTAYSGEWFREDYIKSFSTKYNLDEASQNPNNIIALAGKNCYSMIRKVFSAAGYEKILVSIGDHELGTSIESLLMVHTAD